MPFGSGINIFANQQQPRITSDADMFRLGQEARKQAAYSKMGKAVRGVTEKYKKMSLDELQAEKQKLLDEKFQLEQQRNAQQEMVGYTPEQPAEQMQGYEPTAMGQRTGYNEASMYNRAWASEPQTQTQAPAEYNVFQQLRGRR